MNDRSLPSALAPGAGSRSEEAGGIASREMMIIDVAVGTPVDMGVLDGRGARMMPIVGGTVSGGYDGEVLPGGADWQEIRPDGTIEIRARYVVRIGGEAVTVHSDGLRHGPPEVLARLGRGEIVAPEEYYFRTSIAFRTAAEGLRHLNKVLGVATGERTATGVRLRIYEIL